MGKDDCFTIVIIVLLSLVTILTYFIGYKHGQVDALTGEIHYKLIENSDKTKEWVSID